MRRDYDRFTDLNAEVITIAVDDFSSPSLAARAQEYPFPVLYNKEGDVARAYSTYNQGAGYANPYVFIVDRNGSIVWEQRGSTSHRTSNSAILAQLEKLS